MASSRGGAIRDAKSTASNSEGSLEMLLRAFIPENAPSRLRTVPLAHDMLLKASTCD